MKALLRITVRKLCLPKSDTEKVLYVVEKCHEKTDRFFFPFAPAFVLFLAPATDLNHAVHRYI